MRSKILILLALLGSLQQCAQKRSNKTGSILGSGLMIDNGINRGVNYTDAEGRDYSIRYIPVKISNDSTFPIHFRMEFSKEYNYPDGTADQVFKIIPLPKEWALDGVDITDSMINKLPDYIEKPILKTSLNSGEEYVFAIGTIYPRPVKFSGVLPNILFTHISGNTFPECDWFMKEEPAANPEIAMGLKLKFGKYCSVIPCGQILYSEE